MGEYHLDCPFCGERPKGGTKFDQEKPPEEHLSFIKCPGCGTFTALYTTMDKAWAAWDQRV